MTAEIVPLPPRANVGDASYDIALYGADVCAAPVLEFKRRRRRPTRESVLAALGLGFVLKPDGRPPNRPQN